MLFVDNDTIHVLADLNLLDLLCPALKHDLHHTEVFVLHTAEAKLRGEYRKKKMSDDAWKTVQWFLKKCGRYSEASLHNVQYELMDLPNMEREAALYASAAGAEDGRAVTGDLKSIRAIARLASKEARKLLEGRVLTTEQCLLAIIETQGFAVVDERWADETTTHLFFKDLVGSSETEVLGVLNLRLDQLDVRMKRLIGWPENA